MTNNFYTLKLPDGYIFTSKRDHRLVSKLLLLSNLVALLVLLKYRKLFKYSFVPLLIDYFVYKNYIVEERLMMLSSFGIQIESKSLGNFRTFHSIPIQNIKHLLINEAFLMQEIAFYLLVVLNDSKTMVLPFKKCRINLKNLKTMYNCFNDLFNHNTLNNSIEFVQ